MASFHRDWRLLSVTPLLNIGERQKLEVSISLSAAVAAVAGLSVEGVMLVSALHD